MSANFTMEHFLIKVISKADQSEVSDLLFFPLHPNAAYACFFEMSFCFSVF